MTTLTAESGVTIRPLEVADRAALRVIRAEPSVARRWPAREGDGAYVEEGDEVKFTILVGDEIAGLIQYEEELDPAADNEQAVACYRKVGFRPVGIMRKAERDLDGRGWHDALLMDLLAEEVT